MISVSSAPRQDLEMQANSVYAAFVSFRFGAPSEPDEEVVAAHQALLDRFPRLISGTSLHRRSEHAFFLVFRGQEDIDDYLQSSEVCRFKGCAGCYDLFVQVFELVAMAGASPHVDLPADLPAAAAVPQFEIPAVMPV